MSTGGMSGSDSRPDIVIILRKGMVEDVVCRDRSASVAIIDYDLREWGEDEIVSWVEPIGLEDLTPEQDKVLAGAEDGRLPQG